MTGAGEPGDVRIRAWRELEQDFLDPEPGLAANVLLLGNGFSANIWSQFGYGSLLPLSGLGGASRQLFGDGANFEAVLNDLEIARDVVRVADPDNSALAGRLDAMTDEVRAGLLAAVNAVHPQQQQLVKAVPPEPGRVFAPLPTSILATVADCLLRYQTTFVTNYDLLTYWAANIGQIADLFRGGEPFDPLQAAQWYRWAYPRVLFPHGALHLFRDLQTNAEHKYLAGAGASLMAVIGQTLGSGAHAPLFVSEGSSAQKVARINASPYLSFCLAALRETDGPITILGQALDPVTDRHIADAIQLHPDRRVAIGLYTGPPGAVDEHERQERLRRAAREFRGRVSLFTDVVFFDSAEHPLTAPTLSCSPTTDLPGVPPNS